MVMPDGSVREFSDAQAEDMREVRSSYGTFGVVTEVTYKIRTMQPLAVRHETFSIADFVAKLPELLVSGESIMYYLFPFEDLVTVEFRHYNLQAEGDPNRVAWPLRNYMWGTAGPAFCARVEEDVPAPELRYKIIDGFCALWRFKLEHLVRSDFTVAGDQIIRYPTVAGASKYTFSFWAFPEETFGDSLTALCQFARDYYAKHGYRINMVFVGYRVLKDQQSLLSYTWNGNAITIDPVSTANPGWDQFLEAYNQFSSGRGAIPLLNQTPGLTRAQVEKALGDRWRAFAAARREFDPGNRLLNPYFRDLLGE
jgi:FAD/FMN-containing dehydrogenase